MTVVLCERDRDERILAQKSRQKIEVALRYVPVIPSSTPSLETKPFLHCFVGDAVWGEMQERLNRSGLVGYNLFHVHRIPMQP